MNPTPRSCIPVVSLGWCLIAQPAGAWEFRARFTERCGNCKGHLFNDTIDASELNPRRIRLQIGVFDDDDGPAPAGGVIGWSAGSIVVSADPDNSDERRSNGRIAPFNSSDHPNANGVPPLPDGDPFTTLTDIDASLGLQRPFWGCSPEPGGVPLPMPRAIVRGLNTYVSVYEITIDPHPGAVNYTVSYSGVLAAASEWRIVGTPVPPECGPPPIPGSVVYEPVLAEARPFSIALHIVVPAPSSALISVVVFVSSLRRKRRGNRRSPVKSPRRSG